MRILDALEHIAGVSLMSGKEVIEATVSMASKGAALSRLRQRSGASAVFFAGDDVTDETAFEVLGDTTSGSRSATDRRRPATG